MSDRRPPFDHWPAQHVDPQYGYAWSCGQGLIVSHTTVTHGTTASAHSYHDYESRILREHAAEVAEHGGIFVIHDWRSLVTYEADARRVWQERMQARRKGYLRGSVVCLLRANPLLRMAVQAANLVASLTQNAKVELTTNIEAALAEHDAHPGPPRSRRP
jgi:hypothetical protein